MIDALRAIAVHESGHVVAAVKLGMAARKIEIVGGPDGLDGYSFVDYEQARLSDFLVMILAGGAAQDDFQRITGASAASRPLPNSDGQRIRDAMAQVDRGQRELLVTIASQQARRLVRAHFPMVLAVAGALLDRALTAGGPWQPFEISVSGDDLIDLLGDVALLLRRAV